MKHTAIRSTPEQRHTIELLRTRLAEQGYYIFPVASKFRRHALDFMAVAKPPMIVVFRVRPTLRGEVSIQPYTMPQLHDRLHTHLASIDTPCTARWRKQLPDVGNWRDYLSPESLQEYGHLTTAGIAA